MLKLIGSTSMSGEPEKASTDSVNLRIEILKSLISDTQNIHISSTAQLTRQYEAKMAWLTEELRKADYNSENDCQITEKTTTLRAPSVSTLVDLAQRSGRSQSASDALLHAGMNLSDFARTCVSLSGLAGAKTNDVAQALVQAGHPIANAPDLSKRVGSSLCALKAPKKPSKRKSRPGKHELYRDNETGRFYSPEAWAARQS